VAWECDWAHHASIGGGGSVGGSSGERRRRGRGEAPAAARVPAKLEVGKLNAWPWELEGVLGKGYEGLAGEGNEQSCELTGSGGNGGSAGSGAHAREKEGTAFYSRARVVTPLLHSEATFALRSGYGEPRRAGAVGGRTVPRRARGLTGRDSAWRCMRC
jgi:hypothetical protein